ncbi:uncharacterized protein BX664DRAFT_381806 [Halteromyces radiatus]|uniref:uncharacterized protein n=1 Tax=Halteromyces radiatus TaxID=101107 RepID=UPI00221FB4EA|nr:uncharacterized protein BX664DRAFT_381806 [Halteromyces radiatus]KAI8099213.1 hypothetical protein BX664DRAFT_381806 [Halteromyces radiatus]
MQQMNEELLSNPAGQELRSTDRPMYGMASVNVNGTIYMYGGFYGVSPWNMEALWTLPSTIEPKQLTQIKTDPSASPVLIYSQLIHPPGSSFLYTFGGHHPATSNNGIGDVGNKTSILTTGNRNSVVLPSVAIPATPADNQKNTTVPASCTMETLRYYRYDINLNVWSPLKVDNNTNSNNTNNSNKEVEKELLTMPLVPLERYWHTVTLGLTHISSSSSSSEPTAYLFGGMNTTGPVNDFWQYDFNSNHWTPLSLPSSSWQARCGHTANMLSDGKLVILGGYPCIGNYTTNPVLPKTLISLDHAVIYDTNAQVWYNQTIGGPIIPEARTYHSSVTTKDDQIMICGGQDGAAQPFQTYISAGGDPSAMTAVLDTHVWEWLIPTPSPYQPFPRSFASAVLVNDTKVVIGFGINYHTIYDGMYIFDVVRGSWLPSSQPVHKPIGSNIALIAGLAVMASFVGAIFLVGMSLVVKKLKSRICDFSRKVKNDIWNPRAGEPLWAEMSRLLFRIMFLAVFSTVVVVLILQVRNSPIIDQKYYVHNEEYTVDVPDIRFCFDGWTNDNSVVWPYIQCATDFGDSCSQYLMDISKNVETGLNYYGTTLRCYLFRAPVSFRLGRTNDRIISNGSYLKFYYYGDRLSSNESHLHLVFYNKYHNPNLPVYHIEDPYNLPFSWYSDSEDAQFQSAEEENLRTENAFDLNPNVGSTSSFATIEREEIQSTNFWNYVGIASVHKRAYEIESKAVSETVTTVYATEPQPLGSLHVFPASYEVTVLREQRAFTLVNAMGIIGGIFGLIVGLQACLFGYRPRSPMGLIHRMGMGQMRWSISQGLLATRFDSLQTPVPIVNPVHRRFSHLDIKRFPHHHHHSNMDSFSENEYYHSPPLPFPQEHHHYHHHHHSHDNNTNHLHSNNDNNNDLSGMMEKEMTYVRTMVAEQDETRLARMEERLQLMELLFKSYYINDEVFQSLDKAIKKEEIKKQLASMAAYSNPNAKTKTTTGASSVNTTNTTSSIDSKHIMGNNYRSRKRWFSAFRNREDKFWSHDTSTVSLESQPLPSLANPTRDFVPTTTPSPSTI